MKKKMYITAIILLSAIMLFSAFQLFRYFSNGRQSQNQFDGITEQIVLPVEVSDWKVDNQYGKLFEQNIDMIGWIYIVGTAINYPVMQTPDKPEYYLRRNFEKQKHFKAEPHP